MSYHFPDAACFVYVFSSLLASFLTSSSCFTPLSNDTQMFVAPHAFPTVFVSGFAYFVPFVSNSLPSVLCLEVFIAHLSIVSFMASKFSLQLLFVLTALL